MCEVSSDTNQDYPKKLRTHIYQYEFPQKTTCKEVEITQTHFTFEWIRGESMFQCLKCRSTIKEIACGSKVTFFYNDWLLSFGQKLVPMWKAILVELRLYEHHIPHENE